MALSSSLCTHKTITRIKKDNYRSKLWKHTVYCVLIIHSVGNWEKTEVREELLTLHLDYPNLFCPFQTNYYLVCTIITLNIWSVFRAIRFFNRLKSTKGNIYFSDIPALWLQPFAHIRGTSFSVRHHSEVHQKGEKKSSAISWDGVAVGWLGSQVDGKGKYNRLDKPFHHFWRKLN